PPPPGPSPPTAPSTTQSKRALPGPNRHVVFLSPAILERKRLTLLGTANHQSAPATLRGIPHRPYASSPGIRARPNSLRLEYHALARVPIHQDQQGFREPQMPHAATLLHRGLRRHPRPVHRPFTQVRVHREIAHLKRRQILEEMAALRWRHTEVPESCLHDHSRARDLVPLHRNPQPRFVRAPPPHAHQQVRPALLVQLGIEVRYDPRHFLAVPAFKPLFIHHHDIPQILDAPVAQHLRAVHQQPRGLHVLHAQLFAFLRKHQRADLQKSELRKLTANSISTGWPNASSPSFRSWTNSGARGKSPYLSTGAKVTTRIPGRF